MARKLVLGGAILLVTMLLSASYSSLVVNIFEDCELQQGAQPVSHLVVRSVPVDQRQVFPGTTGWVLGALERFPPGDLLVTVSTKGGLNVDRFYLVGSTLVEQGTYCRFKSSEIPYGEIVDSAIKFRQG